jgi:hypothetical protein
MHWLHGRTSGVYAGSGNAAVTAVQNSMSVSVAPGIGWIADSASNGVCWWFDSAVTLDVDSAEATGTLNRIDRVIVEWPTTDYADKPEVKILKGTSASSAVAPALTNNSTKRQISLARITIPAGTTSLTSGNIIDERLDPTVCGLVTESVTADTSMIARQYNAAIQQLYDGIAQAWEGQISDGAITRKKLSNDQMRTYTSVTQLGLTSGSATVSEILSALPQNAKAFIESTELASGEAPLTGSIEVTRIDEDSSVVFRSADSSKVVPYVVRVPFCSTFTPSSSYAQVGNYDIQPGIYLLLGSFYSNANSGVTIEFSIWDNDTTLLAYARQRHTASGTSTVLHAMTVFTTGTGTRITWRVRTTDGTNTWQPNPAGDIAMYHGLVIRLA